jgi:hypothetical protein
MNTPATALTVEPAKDNINVQGDSGTARKEGHNNATTSDC